MSPKILLLYTRHSSVLGLRITVLCLGLKDSSAKLKKYRYPLNISMYFKYI